MRLDWPQALWLGKRTRYDTTGIRTRPTCFTSRTLTSCITKIHMSTAVASGARPPHLKSVPPRLLHTSSTVFLKWGSPFWFLTPLFGFWPSLLLNPGDGPAYVICSSNPILIRFVPVTQWIAAWIFFPPWINFIPFLHLARYMFDWSERGFHFRDCEVTTGPADEEHESQWSYALTVYFIQSNGGHTLMVGYALLRISSNNKLYTATSTTESARLNWKTWAFVLAPWKSKSSQTWTHAQQHIRNLSNRT